MAAQALLRIVSSVGSAVKLSDLSESEARSHVVIVSDAGCQLSLTPVLGDCRWTSGAASAVARNALKSIWVYILAERSDFEGRDVEKMWYSRSSVGNGRTWRLSVLEGKTGEGWSLQVNAPKQLVL